MKMKLVLGDWSDDGHGKHRSVIYEVNHNVEDVQEAYKESCKLTGVSFNHNEDFTGVVREWRVADKYRICTEYDENTMTPETYEILKAYPGFDDLVNAEETRWGHHIYDFETLWWWFVGLSLPDLTYEKIEDDIPVINGYWDSNLNVQFGYGLF